MSGIRGSVYDLMCFEMINLIVKDFAPNNVQVGDKWSDVIQFRDKERIQKIESLGLSIGYRWAEMYDKHNIE